MEKSAAYDNTRDCQKGRKFTICPFKKVSGMNLFISEIAMHINKLMYQDVT